jgi:hypothetical protein
MAAVRKLLDEPDAVWTSPLKLKVSSVATSLENGASWDQVPSP